MTEKPNVILIDFRERRPWPLVGALNAVGKGEWTVVSKVTNHLHGSKLKSLLRVFWYFFFSLKVFFLRKNYGEILAWQQFFGLNFAFWCRLFHARKRNNLTILTFIYKKKSGFAGLLYHRYMRYIVTGRYVDRFICFSREECHRYAALFGVGEDRFVYIQLGFEEPHDVNTGDDGSILAAGRSNRNYGLLMECVKETGRRCTIVCDTLRPENPPANVEVINDCYGRRMLERMAQCRVVAVPLENLEVSSGQIVIIQAMSLGKPVVCTRTQAVTDYVSDGETGLLVDNDPAQWREALLLLLDDDSKYERMSRRAKEVYHRRFTEEAMYQRIADVIKCR